MRRIGRRGFLGASAAALAVPRLSFANEPLDSVVTAAEAELQLLPAGYNRTRVWAYDGAAPGAGLRVRQGDRVRRVFANELPEPSTIHWHGIRIDNAMDGVAGLTQDPVAPGERFVYDFVLPDAGTFWYHPHRNSAEQVARGLTAPLIVEEPEPPEVDDELVVMLNDWRVAEDGQLLAGFDNMHDRAHAGRIGNYLTVNGLPVLERAARRHERLRLRLVNAASDRIVTLGAEGLDGWVAARDGMPLERPERFERLVLSPAQRADLILDVTAGTGETAYLVSMERDGGYAVVELAVEGSASDARRPAPDPMPPNRWHAPDLASARKVELVMAGGAMGGMAEARVAGAGVLGMRELVTRGYAWALNGVAGMPETPLAELAAGESVRLAMRNDTGWPHAMHLHGHHFRVVGAAGALGPMLDTVLVAPQQTVEIAFVADNPGDWMLHCHMLSHQAAGMGTWLRVAG